MNETNYLGLQKVNPGESLSINDYAFTTRNMDRIDLALYRAQIHQHTGEQIDLEDPADAPGLLLDELGGNIPAGVQATYRYAFVDQYGAETASSPAISVTTAEPVAVPGQPAVARTATGGALMPGNYFYALSAYVNANTNETPTGDRGYTTVPVGTTTNLITLTLPSLPVGADGFNVYRRAPGESVYSYLTSIDMTESPQPTTFVDNGSLEENCNRQPSNQNLTNSSNSVTVTLPGATPTVPPGYTWRLYRTYDDSNWENSLVAWVVEETTENSGVINPVVVDIGATTGAGQPSEVTELAPMPEKIDLTDGAHVQGVLPPSMSPQVLEVPFVFPGPLVVHEGTFVWTCNWDKAKIVKVRATLGKHSYPVADEVIVDVNKYNASAATPGWSTIFTNQANRPHIDVGEQSAVSVPTIVDLFEGDKLSVDVDQVGGGATPTDEDLHVTIVMYVLDETSESVEFADYPV